MVKIYYDSDDSGETILAWHRRLHIDRLAHTDEPVILGEWLRLDGDIKICEYGYHGCREPLDMLEYGSGTVISRIALRGNIQEQSDKVCARERREITLTDSETGARVLRLFACWCAARALRCVGMADSRPWHAIQIAARYAVGKASAEELEEAHDTVFVFGTVVEFAARQSAKAAVHRDISVAARIAAAAGRLAARDYNADRQAQNIRLERMLMRCRHMRLS